MPVIGIPIVAKFRGNAHKEDTLKAKVVAIRSS